MFCKFNFAKVSKIIGSLTEWATYFSHTTKPIEPWAPITAKARSQTNADRRPRYVQSLRD